MQYQTLNLKMGTRGHLGDPGLCTSLQVCKRLSAADQTLT